jgi:hypothetical protein
MAEGTATVHTTAFCTSSFPSPQGQHRLHPAVYTKKAPPVFRPMSRNQHTGAVAAEAAEKTMMAAIFDKGSGAMRLNYGIDR